MDKKLAIKKKGHALGKDTRYVHEAKENGCCKVLKRCQDRLGGIKYAF